MGGFRSRRNLPETLTHRHVRAMTMQSSPEAEAAAVAAHLLARTGSQPAIGLGRRFKALESSGGPEPPTGCRGAHVARTVERETRFELATFCLGSNLRTNQPFVLTRTSVSDQNTIQADSVRYD